jgi:hypothetical protein
MEADQIFAITNDKNIHNIISNLNFISNIRVGEKINVKDLFVRDNDSIVQRVLRTIRNMGTFLSSSEVVESKEATLMFITETLNSAITIISIYKSASEDYKRNIANILIQSLDASKKGIRNVIQTYNSDRKFIAEASAVIKTLEARIDSMRRKGMLSGISDDSFLPEQIIELSSEE